nr:MAG TPA: hypothetical protein [Caudoviricetes sp.]
MGLRCTPQSTGPRFNPCDVDIVVAILDDCRHRWIGGHNVFEVVFIRKYYNLIEPRRGKTHRCSHRPHPLHLPPHQVRALLSGLLDFICGIMLAKKIINSDTISSQDDIVYCRIHPAPNSRRFSLPIQNHRNVRLSYPHFFGKVIVCNSLVVHLPDEIPGPCFRQNLHPL